MIIDMDFNLETLKTITRNFSEDLKIGSGGYGDVYKGLYEGKEIAVKRLKPLLGLDNKEFENEFSNLREVQHENVVKLIGFCRESKTKFVEHEGKGRFAEIEERILCFELMQGGALDKHILEDSCDLDWPTCYKIIKGTCEGINHLHTAYKRPILHLDLKPGNILLDKNKNPKVADLGLSRLTTQTLVTKNAKGTTGYMAPEFRSSGCISQKYDVFSLGVIILNVMDGRWGLTHCLDKGHGEFVNFVCANWNQRSKEKPGHLSHTIESLQVKKCVELALKCVQKDRRNRPSTKDIVKELDELDAKNKKLSLASDDDQIDQVLGATKLNSSVDEDLSSQLPSRDQLLVSSISGPGQLDVVIVYAFDCTDWTSAWYTVDDGIFWMVQEKLTHYIDSCMGYIYFKTDGNTYTSDMKLVDPAETESKSYSAFARRRVACTKNMASGLDEAHKMISDRGYPNGVILLFSDGLKHKGDFFDGAEEYKSKVPVHTFTLGGVEYNQGLRAIAENSTGGKFHTIPVPERPMLSARFSLLLDCIFDRTTFEDEESPSPSSEMQPLDVVLVYAFDCTDSTAAWYKVEMVFYMVLERLTRLEDSCMGFIYPRLEKNDYTSDMKLVDSAEWKAFARYRISCTKNMASGLAVAHKMLRNRGNQNGIVLFFSDGLINKGDFFDGTESYKSEFPVHTFTLGGDAYNNVLQAIADNSRGGMFHSTPVPERPKLSPHFSEILDSLLLGTKTNRIYQYYP